MTQSGDNDVDWTRQTGGTKSGDTGPSRAHRGTHYVYVEASSTSDNDKA